MPVRTASRGVPQQVERHATPECTAKVPQVPEESSTYGALCAFIRSYQESRGDVGDVPEGELHDLLEWLNVNNCDIWSHSDFPSNYCSDDSEVEKAITLLARLQNLVVMIGAPRDDAPMIQDITQYCLASRKGKPSRYNIGDWAEVRGKNLEWRLERLIDTLKLKDHGEETLYYSTAVDHKLTEENVRLPKDALLYVFGASPWIWQQWACLRVEHVLRFQDGHQNDFEIFDIQGYVEELWDLWLNNPKNKDFADLFLRVGEFGQEELIKHVMEPFDLMRDVRSNSSGQWDLKDVGLSVYTYLSVLGSGFTDAFLIFVLQVSMPSILYIFYINAARQGGGEVSLIAGTRVMLFFTLLYYLFKTTRDLDYNFRRIICGSDSAYSRILNIRKRIWEDGNDNFPQSIGYVFDLFMNTGYVCVLYIYNMYILFNTIDAFNILSSVVVFELLLNLDEEIAASSWWDDGGRWMKAGIIEMILQQTIRREYNHSWDQYFSHFSQSLTKAQRQQVQERFVSAGFTEITFLVGSESHDTITLLTIGERIEQKRWREAEEEGIADSSQLDKQDVYFGGLLTYGIAAVFQKHQNYRAWLQWEQLLFLFPVPTLVPDNFDAGSRLELNPELSGRRVIAMKARPTQSSSQKFWGKVADVLTLKETKRSFKIVGNLERR